ncbi:hypothetical protein [Kitasatospora sp. NPDC017646]|uniref:hypothetical protein n=1 Tax=Kitasatospora sp. NPDC017646 TaxID=3364024 RepID=UPI00378C01F4
MQTAQEHASFVGILGTGAHLPATAVDNTLAALSASGHHAAIDAFHRLGVTLTRTDAFLTPAA